jgi:RNase adaptor protein for sRNA GlmZ degradation
MILSSDSKEVKALGHNKDEIDELHKSAIRVKELSTGGGLEKLVERIEQKRRVHDMSAKVAVEIEQLETQQLQMIGSMKENKELLDYIKEGLAANMETIKKNIEHLKRKRT